MKNYGGAAGGLVPRAAAQDLVGETYSYYIAKYDNKKLNYANFAYKSLTSLIRIGAGTWCNPRALTPSRNGSGRLFDG